MEPPGLGTVTQDWEWRLAEVTTWVTLTEHRIMMAVAFAFVLGFGYRLRRWLERRGG